MPIEFRCHACDKLLRVPDDAGGKQAKCPECGEIVDVPLVVDDSAQPPADDAFAPGGAPWPSSPAPGKPPAAGPDDVNPFASPAAPGREAGPMDAADDEQYRDGPPWERDGASVGSYIETLKLVFTSTNYMFDTMRRFGGMGSPIFYAMVGGMIGVIAGQIYGFFINSFIFANLGGRGFGGQAFANPMMQMGLVGTIVAIILSPIAIIIGLFISAGINHLMLMILGEGHLRFETTFRVVAYVFGTTYLLNLVPGCGGCFALILNIVFMIIGLSRAHRISGGKASAVVLLPFVVCCAAYFVLIFVFVAALMPMRGM